MENKEPTSFLWLLEDYIELFKDEEELRPFLEPTAFPRYSEFLNIQSSKISSDKIIKFYELEKIWTIISIVHYIEDFTLNNANIVLTTLEDKLFMSSNSSKHYEFQTERKQETYSIIAEMDINITMKFEEAASKDSEEELIEWLLFAEKIRRKWVKFDMKSTVKIGLIYYMQKFGQERIKDRKLLILALKFLGSDENFKFFLEQEAIKYLESHIDDRATSKEILKLLSNKSHKLSDEDSKKIKIFENQLEVWTIKTQKEIRRNFRNIRRFCKGEKAKGFKVLAKEDIIREDVKDIVNASSNSKIYMGTLNNKKVAVKEYKIEKSKWSMIKLFCNEAANAIFLSEKDEIFMKFYGIYKEFEPLHSDFTFAIVMEQCDMDLERAIKEKLLSSDKNIEYCIDTLLKGFKLLHDYGIAHRDIKPQNIFVKNTKRGLKLKIADYNISSLISKGTALFSYQTLFDNKGQRTYIPPECVQNDGDNGPKTIVMNKQKADVYSLGLVFLELCKQEIHTFSSYIEREEWISSYINCDIKPYWIKDLLNLMLTKNPKERKRLSELIKIRAGYQNNGI
ncbi:unnamed protein product [Blepharisma stoltei]|uniref:Protein kinase domain-containing protein n=1 Tax=Blepharisma stoltei TaxID=1481888 RepID=A0AAU9J3H0_9CILI|nr:unnamed protein product [Blepharisma stoltei]